MGDAPAFFESILSKTDQLSCSAPIHSAQAVSRRVASHRAESSRDSPATRASEAVRGGSTTYLYLSMYRYTLYSTRSQTTRSEEREARSEKRETRSEKQEARCKKQKVSAAHAARRERARKKMRPCANQVVDTRFSIPWARVEEPRQMGDGLSYPGFARVSSSCTYIVYHRRPVLVFAWRRAIYFYVGFGFGLDCAAAACYLFLFSVVSYS